MIGLIKKDLLSFREGIAQMLILVIIMPFFALLQDSPSFLTGIYVAIPFIWMLTAFNYDESSKWDSFAISQALSRQDIINAKYIFAFVSGLISCLLLLMTIFILSFFSDVFVIDQEALMTVLSSFIMYNILVSLIYPIIYKFGIQKSRLVFAAGIFVIILAGGALFNGLTINTNSMGSIFEFINDHFIFVLAITAIILETLSLLLSHRIYKNKDIA